MATITPDDVAVTLGRPITDDFERMQVDRWISDAELLVRTRLGDLALLDQAVLAYVLREAVVARLRNPDGVSFESIDDYSYRMPEESRRVTILDEWWDLLSPASANGAFTVRGFFTADVVDPTVNWA